MALNEQKLNPNLDTKTNTMLHHLNTIFTTAKHGVYNHKTYRFEPKHDLINVCPIINIELSFHKLC